MFSVNLRWLFLNIINALKSLLKGHRYDDLRSIFHFLFLMFKMVTCAFWMIGQHLNVKSLVTSEIQGVIYHCSVNKVTNNVTIVYFMIRDGVWYFLIQIDCSRYKNRIIKSKTFELELCFRPLSACLQPWLININNHALKAKALAMDQSLIRY